MRTIKEKNKKYLGAFYCITAALIWGLSFVAQSVGMQSVGTFTFNGLRMLLGSTVLVPVILLRGRKAPRPEPAEARSGRRELLTGGLISGIVLFAGSNLQQQAFLYLEVGKVGFITALYMVIVPVFGLFLGKKSSLNAWLGVALGAVGLYLLCIKEGGFSLETGDILTICCAVCFAVHILVLDRYSKTADGVKLSCLQFLTAGILSLISMAIFETPEWAAIKSVMPSILYAGIMSCGVAFTFQIFGQKYTEPAVASLLLCLESAFALMFGWLILDERLGNRALVGCAIMLTAVMLTQVQIKKKATHGK